MQGGRAMDLMLSRDIRQILLETEKAKDGLERLKRDHAVWDREGAEEDLVRLTGQATRLEVDLSLILSHCMPMSQCSGGDSNEEASQDLRQDFVALNALFTILKKARVEISQAYIHPDTLKQLGIIWDRFTKKIEKTQEHLQGRDKRLDVSLMAAMVKD